MKITLIFISPNGTTKKTAKEIQSAILNHNHEVEIIDIGDIKFRGNYDQIFKILKNSDIVGFGTPIYHMDILEPINKLLHDIINSHIEFKFKAFLFANYAGITSGKTFINFAKILGKREIPIIGGLKIAAPHFHHNEEFPNNEIKEIITNFISELEENNFAEIEQKRLKDIFSPEKFRVNILYPIAHIISKKRELTININNEKCVKCQKCIRECPKGAIKFNNGLEIDFDLCIHCYHCVITCPVKAVEAPIEKLDKMISLNKKIVGMEYPLSKILI